MEKIKSMLKKVYRIIVISFFKVLYGKVEYKKNYGGNIQKIYVKNSKINKNAKKKYCITILKKEEYAPTLLNK